MNDAGRPVVRDEQGRPLALLRRIGVGGQAEVWASEGRVAVKMMHARTPRVAQRLRSRIGVIRRLDLGGVPIARPLAMLAAPHVGYSMELLDDMVAVQTLVSAPDDRDLLGWYAETGGLRRRLRLLSRAADAFAALHAKGVVYADPSPANVMVSDTPRHEEVRLVDVDFVRSESVVPDTVATPGYAAPEVLDGRSGVSGATDAYAFAVIAFEVLTLTHPFLGDAVQEGGPELLEHAFSGKLPWIDHPDDRSNRTRYGLPRERLLTSKLGELARRAFQDGLSDVRARPTVAEWRTALRSAADLTLACAGCPQSVDMRAPACPWCGLQAPDPLVAVVEFVRSGMPKPAPAGETLAVPPGAWLPITGRTSRMDAAEYDTAPVAWLHWQPGHRLTIRNPGPVPLWLTSAIDQDEGLVIEPSDELAVPADQAAPRWIIRFGPPGSPHRMLRFARVRRSAARS
ncbi:protein kinase domain-containing protein [Streptosporangium sp. H16]|uniref:protein kinase domain-containing protein n=1 Tax=Streptosporangium sp. H16 TaxID=3444184 RepID=UPI003F7AAD61